MKHLNFQKAFPKICNRWSVVTNYSHHHGGRIWLVWLAIFLCEYMGVFYVAHSLYAEHMPTRKSFALTVVYGSNDTDERKSLWRELHVISGCITCT